MSNQIDFHSLEQSWIEDSKEKGMNQFTVRSMIGFSYGNETIYFFPASFLMGIQEKLEYLELDNGYYDVSLAEAENFREESLSLMLKKGEKKFQICMTLYYSQGDLELQMSFAAFKDTEDGIDFFDELLEEERKDVETAIKSGRLFFEECGYSRLDLAVSSCIYSFGDFQYLIEEG